MKTDSKVFSRNGRIDIMKGVCIILMVWGHSGEFGTHFVSLFHMAVFFMISGFLFKESNTDSREALLGFCMRKLKSLWLPYVLWNAVFTLLSKGGMTGKEMFTNILKGIFFAGGTQIGGALWFLKVLFVVSVAYACIDFLIKRIARSEKGRMIVQGMVSLLLLGCGYYCNMKEHALFGISTAFSCYSLFYLGVFLKDYMDKMRNKYISCSLCTVSVVILILCNRIESIAINLNQYENPITYLLAALAGWFLLYKISEILYNLSGIKHFLSILGQNTLAIVALHLLCFRMVNWIQVEIYDMPFNMITSFPVLYGIGMWRALYTIVGIAIPVALNIGRKKIKTVITNRSA